MNYELAKQLKDAGFPQRSVDMVSEKNIFPDECSTGYGFKLDDKCYKPTIEELIEACGEDFNYLERYGGGDRWICVKWKPYRFECTDGLTRKGCLWEEQSPWGYTPTEAVAKLWLELNKK